MKYVPTLALSLTFGFFAAVSMPAQSSAPASNPTPGQLEPAAGAAPVPAPGVDSEPDAPGLPRVLLIGDSISQGYLMPVRTALKGRANIHHPPENCGPTERGLANLDRWLGGQHWDVIHFNFGLHDLKYLDAQGNYTSPSKGKQVAPVAVYAENLRMLVARLQKTGAKLIFATTTPVPAGTSGRRGGDDRKYNEAATKVMQETGVAIDDLGGYVEKIQAPLPPPAPKPPKGHPAPRPGDIQLPYNVHFSKEGYQQLAEQVAASISKALPATGH